MSLRLRTIGNRVSELVGMGRWGKTALILNTLSIFVVLNLVVSFLPIKLDLTENKEFSLSKTTKDALLALDDLVIIKAFISQGLPPKFLPTIQRIKDSLSEYQKAAKGKLKVYYLDPKNDSETANQAQNLGIPLIRFSDIQGDKLSVSTGFLGIAVTFADKKTEIPFVSEETNLEYDLTSAVIKVSSKNPTSVGITSGHGETGTEKLSLMRNLLQKDFELEEIKLDEGLEQGSIREGVKTILMINPREKFNDRTLYLLDQFLLRGGALVVLINPVEVSGNLTTSNNVSNISRIIENFGAKAEPDLVLSADNEIANFSSGFTAILVPYPFWVRVPKTGFNANYPSLASLDTAMFPWVSSLSLNKDLPKDLKVAELIKSSQRSFSAPTPFNLDPSQEFNPKTEDLRQFRLGVLISGKTESLFKRDKNLSQIKGKDEKFLESSEREGKLVVLGDADFVTDNFVGRFAGNGALLSNLVESVSTEANLSQIRSKGLSFRALREVPESYKNFIKWGNVFASPILISILGAVRILRRFR